MSVLYMGVIRVPLTFTIFAQQSFYQWYPRLKFSVFCNVFMIFFTKILFNDTIYPFDILQATSTMSVLPMGAIHEILAITFVLQQRF